MVWSSWISHYDEAREEDIVNNAHWLAANLAAVTGFGADSAQQVIAEEGP
jgi:hypothetical protein